MTVLRLFAMYQEGTGRRKISNVVTTISSSVFLHVSLFTSDSFSFPLFGSDNRRRRIVIMTTDCLPTEKRNREKTQDVVRGVIQVVERDISYSQAVNKRIIFVFLLQWISCIHVYTESLTRKQQQTRSRSKFQSVH